MKYERTIWSDLEDIGVFVNMKTKSMPVITALLLIILGYLIQMLIVLPIEIML